jgi:16S rRNA (guanine966-N2)-methyltransferase
LTDRLRESLFAMLASRMPIENARVLDLFAGCGSISYEALSRGAASATLVELNGKNLRYIRETATTLGFQQLTLHKRRVEQFLQTPSPQPYDFIMLDPPYAHTDKAGLLEAARRAEWLAGGGWLVLHHPGQEHYAALWPGAEERRFGGATLTLLPGPGLS